MRGAVRGVLVRGIRIRERAYSFNAHFRVERGVRAVLYNDYLYRYANRRNLKLNP
jgi:hypothetical protein